MRMLARIRKFTMRSRSTATKESAAPTQTTKEEPLIIRITCEYGVLFVNVIGKHLRLNVPTSHHPLVRITKRRWSFNLMATFNASCLKYVWAKKDGGCLTIWRHAYCETNTTAGTALHCIRRDHIKQMLNQLLWHVLSDAERAEFIEDYLERLYDPESRRLRYEINTPGGIPSTPLHGDMDGFQRILDNELALTMNVDLAEVGPYLA